MESTVATSSGLYVFLKGESQQGGGSTEPTPPTRTLTRRALGEASMCGAIITPVMRALKDLRAWFPSFAAQKEDFFRVRREEEFLAKAPEDIKTCFNEAKKSLDAQEFGSLKRAFQELQGSWIGESNVDLEAVVSGNYQAVHEIFVEANFLMRGIESTFGGVISALKLRDSSDEVTLCQEVIQELFDSVCLRRGVIASGAAILRCYLDAKKVVWTPGDSVVAVKGADSFLEMSSLHEGES